MVAQLESKTAVSLQSMPGGAGRNAAARVAQYVANVKGVPCEGYPNFGKFVVQLTSMEIVNPPITITGKKKQTSFEKEAKFIASGMVCTLYSWFANAVVANRYIKLLLRCFELNEPMFYYVSQQLPNVQDGEGLRHAPEP